MLEIILMTEILCGGLFLTYVTKKQFKQSSVNKIGMENSFLRG